MIRRQRRASLRGFNILTATIAAMVVGIISMGTLSAIVSAIRLDSLSEERNLAIRAVETEFEEIQVMDRNIFLQTFPEDLANSSAGIDRSVSGLTEIKNPDGTIIPNIRIFVIPPEGVLSYDNADIYTVHIRVRWENRQGLGPFREDYTLIVSPPDRFD